MKRILLFLLMIWGVAEAQTPAGYTRIFSRYDLIAGMSDSGWHVPVYGTTPYIRPGVTTRAGNIGLDTVANALYYYSGGSWLPVFSSGSGWSLTGNGSTSGKFLGTTDALPLAIYTNNAERLRVLSGGNVGIGTATPSVLLDVNGQMRMRTGATNGYIIQGDVNGVFSWIDPTTIRPSFGQVVAVGNQANARIVVGALSTTTAQLSLHQSSLTTGTGYALRSENACAIAGSGGTDNMYGIFSKVSAGRTGAGTLNNIAGYFQSINGDNNYALIVPSASGNIGFGTTTPVISAIVDVTSTTQGILFPRMTGAQQNAISSPATGLIIYNTDSSALCYYTGAVWLKVSQGGGGSSSLTSTYIGYGDGSNALSGDNKWTRLTNGVHIESEVTTQPRDYMTTNYVTGVNGGSVLLRHARGSKASPAQITTDDALGSIAWAGYAASVGFPSNDHQAVLSVKASQAYTNTAQGNYMTFELTADNASSTAEIMRVTGNGALLIGNSAPIGAEKLLVNGTAYVNNDLSVNGTIKQLTTAGASTATFLKTNNANNASTTNLNPGISYYTDGGNQWGAYLGYNAGTSRFRQRLYMPTGGDISFATISGAPTAQSDFTDVMTIRGDNSGRVGIGTAAPDNTLTVNGNADFTGNVGIGTASPAALFDVYNGTTHNFIIDPAGNAIFSNILGSSDPTNLQSNSTIGIDDENSGFQFYATNDAGSTSTQILGLGVAKTITYRADNGHTFTGNVGITGTFQTSGVNTLTDLAGTGTRAVLADASGVLSAPISDLTTKENINDLNIGISTLMRLRPVSFEYRDGFKNYGKGTQIGFIAQDIQQILPNSTYINNSNGKMGYNEIDLLPITIKALQEAVLRIEALEKEVKKLKRK